MAGTLFSPPRLRAVSTAGDPIPGAKLYWYRAGTTVLASTYTSASLSVEHPNPQVSDLAGEFRAIYLDPDAGYNYRAVCTTPSGVQLWVEDDIPPGVAAVDGGGGGGGTSTPGDPGLSVAELSIYVRSETTPATPSGGSFNFATQLLTPPTGWEIGIPVGFSPVWISKAVAAVEGTTGTDSILAWTAPVRFTADGSSVDIIFKRSATQPATPAPSTGVPAGWYSDVGAVPVSTDRLWSSVGTRDNASQNWIWQLPIQVEGDPGPPGLDATLYYIKPTQGTALKNGTGQLTVEARKVFAGNDVLLSSGSVQLYVGSTLVTAANGYVTGSNGYTGIFDAGDISGAAVVSLKNGPSGEVLDTITLVDIADGEADTGKNAVYGYIEASNGLAWVRGIDQTTWSPSANTTRLDCTFVQGGAAVARVAWLVTRAADGTLTGASTTHGAGDLNGSRVTVSETNEGSRAFTVKFDYANAGDVSSVAETVLTSLSGADGDPGDIGATGPTGPSGLSVAELAIYQRASVAPSAPTGGSYDFDTKVLTAPSGWSSEVPAGYEPVYASRSVAAITGTSGVDSTLTWSTPVRAFEDGASIDIVFKRNATQPSTPANSSGVPAGWYSDVGSVPASSDPLWSSVGSRSNAAEDWVWQTPIRVEGEQGPPGNDGEDALLYYIKPLDGAAIKNSLGTLRLEARKLEGGTDTLLSAGTIQLYDGTTAKGYSASFGAADITGAVVITLKDGSGGTELDSITLVDVTDGSTGGPGTNAVYGYIEPDGPLAWVRASDGTTWTPSDTTLQFNCTFVQGGADVARVGYVLTRASNGLITGATGTHPSGDLNTGRVTVTPSGSGTQVFTVKFAYSYVGDTAVVAETAYTSMSGTSGPTGPTGPSAVTMTLSARSIPLFAYQNGTVQSYATANGLAKLWSGTTEVTNDAGTAFSIVSSSGVTGQTINTAANTPIASQPKGYYQITGMPANVGSITIRATYGGQTIDEVVSFSKIFAGYEIVAALPTTNNFIGRIVFLDTVGQQKLYRYTSSGWVAWINGADILANSVTTDAMFAGTITTAKLRVTSLDVLSTNAGTITAGILQSPTGGARFDLTNARIIYNSAPGATGGFVRVQGAGFGPSSNYLDWYGPKPAGQTTDSGIVGALTDAAAYYYLKTDGTSKSVANRVRGEFEPKAWCAFNGLLAAPQVLTDAFNVSSVSRSAVGIYRVHFINSMPNTNYVVVGSGYVSETVSPVVCITGRYVDYCTIYTFNAQSNNNSKVDCSLVCLAIFGSNVVGGSNITSPLGGVGGGTIGYGSTP